MHAGQCSHLDRVLISPRKHPIATNERVIQNVLLSAADSYLSPPSSAGATSSDSTFSLASSTASKSASKPRRPLPSEPAVMVEDDADATATGSLSSPSPFDTSSADSGGGSVVSSLQIPKSPCTPRSMGHAISHRFKKTLKPARCDHCSEYMFNGK